MAARRRHRSATVKEALEEVAETLELLPKAGEAALLELRITYRGGYFAVAGTLARDPHYRGPAVPIVPGQLDMWPELA